MAFLMIIHVPYIPNENPPQESNIIDQNEASIVTNEEYLATENDELSGTVINDLKETNKAESVEEPISPQKSETDPSTSDGTEDGSQTDAKDPDTRIPTDTNKTDANDSDKEVPTNTNKTKSQESTNNDLEKEDKRNKVDKDNKEDHSTIDEQVGHENLDETHLKNNTEDDDSQEEKVSPVKDKEESVDIYHSPVEETNEGNTPSTGTTEEESIEMLEPITPTTLKNLVPLIEKPPLHQEVENLLINEGKANNLEKSIVGEKRFIRFSYIEEDSKQCENILNMLKAIGVGFTADTSISVFPSSVHESGKGDLESIASEKSLEDLQGRDDVPQDTQNESVFKKSIKSRLVVAQVVASVRSNALFTFDYLLLLLLASFIACIGLAESSSVVLVASMLISPLMGPILAGTFGQVVKMKDLRNLGVRSELLGLSLCLLVGFGFGLVTGGIGLHGAIWGSTDQWPTPEMKSRGMLRSLWVGMLIALPSGAGVAISVLSANAGSLVGVAISASLLPPACNAGMLWGYSLLAAIRAPSTEVSGISTAILSTLAQTTPGLLENSTNTVLSINSTNTTVSPLLTTSGSPLVSPGNDQSNTLQCPPLVNNAYIPEYSCNLAIDAAVLGFVSLFLTILNILCIFLVGVVFLKIKEVAPHTAGKGKATDNFWHEDVKVARTYYQTSKGETSTLLGKQFLQEWKKIKQSDADNDKKNTRKDSMLERAETIEMCQYLAGMQNSPDMQIVLSKLNTPTSDLMVDLETEFIEAKKKLQEEIFKHPGYALSNTVLQRMNNDKKLMRAYHTLSVAAPEPEKPSIFEMRKRFRKMGGVQSMFIEMQDETTKPSPYLSEPLESSLGKRRRERKEKTVKFDVQRVDEEAEELPLIMP